MATISLPLTLAQVSDRTILGAFQSGESWLSHKKQLRLSLYLSIDGRDASNAHNDTLLSALGKRVLNLPVR
jgi:hypothetical protein